MKKEEKELLTAFETNLKQLIYLHDKLKLEKADLEKRLKEKEEENNRIRQDFKRLETDYTNFKAAMAINLTGNDVRETKLRLSKLVREVDKCIALLNE